MKLRLWPATLSGRLTWILLAGLVAAHALSFWLVFMERGMASRGMMVSYLARDVASSVAILERVPPAERASWLPKLERRNYSFRLGEAAGGTPSRSMLAEPVARALSLTLEPARDVAVVEMPGSALRLQLHLTDGTPLAVDLADARIEVSTWVLVALALQLALLGVLTAIAVRQATRPLQALAGAADALGPAQPDTPLAEDGPREVAQAAAAFNAMQRRIRSHLDERMQILAAVSHDLQTPITRLRLRAEMLDDTTLRDKLMADLAQMQSLVEEGISYARSAQASREPAQPVDLGALLDSITCDYTDAGKPVSLRGDSAVTLATRPMALRRLVGNLVDNALKFAGAAEIELRRQPDGVAISVLDRGPGIPEAELQAVLQPFYRVENSRSRETGGTGLGLAIAHELAQALGTSLVLAARPGGGLEARVVLPVQSA